MGYWLGSVGLLNHGLTLTFGSAKVFSSAMFETCFSYDKEIWIGASDYYMYVYIIVLFSLTPILQLQNFTASFF